MSWFSELFRRKALRGSPEFVESLAARQVTGYPAIGGTNLSRMAINRAYEQMHNAAYSWLYQSQPAVRSVVDYIARNATQLGPPKLFERTGPDEREREERPAHAAAETLRQPHLTVTPGATFMRAILSDFLVYDDAYALKLRRSPGDPLVLLQLPPHCVGTVGMERFSTEGYNVYRADGSYFTVAPDDMIHWHGYNPDDPRVGYSRLETLREVIAEEAAMQMSNLELAKSGLGLPGHIERPLEAPEWTPQAQQRFEEDWANRMKNKERRTPVLEEGMEFKEAAMTPKDAEVLKSRQFSREEVAAQYGMWHVPPRREEEKQSFYSEVLAPLLDEYCAFLTLQLLDVEFGETDMYFEASLDEKLIGDDRLKAMTSASGGPVLTRDEARARIGLPPKPGGDQLITPLNVTVGGKPSPHVMPIQDPNGPSQEGDERKHVRVIPWDIDQIRAEVERMKNEENNAERLHIGPIEGEDAEEPETKAIESADQKALTVKRRAAQMKRREEYRDDIEEVLTRNFDRLERDTKAENKAIKWDRWIARLKKELYAIAKAIVQREGGLQAVRFGLADIDMAKAEPWLREMADARASDIGVALQKAFDSDDFTPAQVLDEAKNTEGPRAAETLASGIASFAVLEAAEQSPDREERTKTWIVTSENSAHPEMDGETVELGKKFSNGRKGPPADHPGCQCLVEVN